jgi:hypothetical protein
MIHAMASQVAASVARLTRRWVEFEPSVARWPDHRNTRVRQNHKINQVTVPLRTMRIMTDRTRGALLDNMFFVRETPGT